MAETQKPRENGVEHLPSTRKPIWTAKVQAYHLPGLKDTFLKRQVSSKLSSSPNQNEKQF